MDYIDHTAVLIASSWPTFLIIAGLIIAAVGAWLAFTTWRENRRMAQLQATLKKNVYASRI